MKWMCVKVLAFYETFHRVSPSILKTTTTTVSAWRCVHRDRFIIKKKKGASACVGVCFCLSKLCQLPENGPAWMKWAKQEGVRVKPLIKEAVSANILFIIVLCQRTLLWCCSVVRLSCFCVLQFSTAHTNSDSSSCVWLYNYHEAWAYYLQGNCGAGILHTFRKYTVYKTSETFHSRQYSWVMLL